MGLYDILNILFFPLLQLPPVLSITLISLLVSLFITILTKYMTDQNLMKRLREETKELQKQTKQARTDPKRLMELQKRQMEMTMQQFKQSFKPTLITFIPIILIFGWMSSVFAYESIKPQQEFNVYAVFAEKTVDGALITVQDGITVIGNKTAKIGPAKVNKIEYQNVAKWTLKGSEGDYILEISAGKDMETKDVSITSGHRYKAAEKTKKSLLSISSGDNYLLKGSGLNLVRIDYKKLVVLPIGFRDWFGWLGVYLWSSIIFTMALRKLMKIY